MSERLSEGTPSPATPANAMECSVSHRTVSRSVDGRCATCFNDEREAAPATPEASLREPFDLDLLLNDFFNATQDGSDEAGELAQDAIVDGFAAIQAERDQLRAANLTLRSLNEHAAALYDEQAAEVESLRSALREAHQNLTTFGSHKRDCNLERRYPFGSAEGKAREAKGCTCGFRAALDAAARETT